VTVLRRLAQDAPAPVFVARGGGAGLLPVELQADPRLRMVGSARHATVLLAAGRFAGAMGDALDRVHDQLPSTGAVVWWTADPDAARPPSLAEATVFGGPDPVEAVLAAHRRAVSQPGARRAVLADEPPHPFEGRGDHGQGGEGMMGGVPFGRAMAMTADDRDGLALDQLPLQLGPFLLGLPNGVRVSAVLQGGVVQEAELEGLDLGEGRALAGADATGARADLRWLAEALRLGGLDALARRAARLARAGATDAAACARVAKLVRRSGLPAAWSKVGVVEGEDARSRLERRLRFDPRAGGRRPLPADRIGRALAGQDWSDALVTIWSFASVGERAPAAAAP